MDIIIGVLVGLAFFSLSEGQTIECPGKRTITTDKGAVNLPIANLS